MSGVDQRAKAVRFLVVMGSVALLGVIALVPANAHLPATGRPAPHALVVGPAANNTTGWTHLLPGTVPPALVSAGFAYDPADGYDVLFGGCTSGDYWYSTCTPSNQTWVFSGGDWSQLHPAVSPPGRYYTGLTWDATDGYLVLFGGNSSNGFLNDTWSFLHGNWTQLHPTTSPAVRAAFSMTYDPAAGGVLLYGGEQYRQLVNAATESYNGADTSDTWLYANGTWTLMNPVTNPGPRDSEPMIYDPALQAAVLYGGFTWVGGGANLGDVWAYANGTWTELTAMAYPGGLNNPSFGYSIADGTAILYGGHDQYSFNNNTWAMPANGSWTYLTGSSGPAAPPTRFGASMTYDPGAACLVLYGGYIVGGSYSQTGYYRNYSIHGYYNDTWEWGTNCNLTANSTTGASSGGSGNGAGKSPTSPLRIVVTERAVATQNPRIAEEAYSVSISGGVAPYTVQWAFGDGSFGSALPGATVTHVYAHPGVFHALVTVTDGAGTIATSSLQPVSLAPPAVSAVGLTSVDVYAVSALALVLMVASGLYVHHRQVARRRLDAEAAALVTALRESPVED